MARRNPLIAKKPINPKIFNGNKSAGILDDFAVRKSVNSLEGYYSKYLIVGEDNTVTGTECLTVGNNNTNSGLYSGTIGSENDVSGQMSVAYGYNNEITSGTSVAFGRNNAVGGVTTSLALGSGLTITTSSTLKIGWGGDTIVVKDEDVDITGTLDVSGITTLGDGSALASSAAPTTDAMIANKKYVDDNGGYAYYDAVVDSGGGGDYTSIATALSTEGSDKSIFVKRGSYNESTDVEFYDNQNVFFDNVIINFDTGYKMYFPQNVDDINLIGKLELSGEGDSGGALISTYGSSGGNYRINAGQCMIKLTGTKATYSATANLASIFGRFGIWNFTIKDWTFAGHSSGYTSGVRIGSVGNHYRIAIDTITNATGQDTAGVYVFNAQNTVDVFVNAVTTSSGNKGKGVWLVTNGNYNSVIGSSRGSQANLTDGGTGNKTGSLAV